MKNTIQKYKNSRAKGGAIGGFTLIELLIVIAVIGVLAAVVLLAIDPLEQLRRGRDASRKTTIGQIGRALAAYATINNGQFIPDTESAWLDVLQDSGEIKTAPSNPSGSITCPSGFASQEDYCYDNLIAADDEAIVFTGLESESEESKCELATPGSAPYFAWSSVDGRAGLICVTGTAFPTANTPLTFVGEGS